MQIDPARPIPRGRCPGCRSRLETSNRDGHVRTAHRAIWQYRGQCRRGVLVLRAGGRESLHHSASAMLGGVAGHSRFSQDRPRRRRHCCTHDSSGRTFAYLSLHRQARLWCLRRCSLSEAVSGADSSHCGQYWPASSAGHVASNACGKGRRSGPHADQRELVRCSTRIGEARYGRGGAAPYSGEGSDRIVPGTPASRYGGLSGDPAAGIETGSHKMFFCHPGEGSY